MIQLGRIGFGGSDRVAAVSLRAQSLVSSEQLDVCCAAFSLSSVNFYLLSVAFWGREESLGTARWRTF